MIEQEAIKESGAQDICPICQQGLIFKNNNFYCKHCKKYFKEEVHCVICHAKVEVTSGCGATTYYCPNDKLLSRKQCIFTYLEI